MIEGNGSAGAVRPAPVARPWARGRTTGRTYQTSRAATRRSGRVGSEGEPPVQPRHCPAAARRVQTSFLVQGVSGTSRSACGSHAIRLDLGHHLGRERPRRPDRGDPRVRAARPRRTACHMLTMPTCTFEPLSDPDVGLAIRCQQYDLRGEHHGERRGIKRVTAPPTPHDQHPTRRSRTASTGSSHARPRRHARRFLARHPRNVYSVDIAFPRGHVKPFRKATHVWRAQSWCRMGHPRNE
jgi:hypothetical protein